MMHNQANSKAAVPSQGYSHWFGWARKHPGVLLLGTLAVAVLAFRKSPSPQVPEVDAGGDEVFLFI